MKKHLLLSVALLFTFHTAITASWYSRNNATITYNGKKYTAEETWDLFGRYCKSNDVVPKRLSNKSDTKKLHKAYRSCPGKWLIENDSLFFLKTKGSCAFDEKKVFGEKYEDGRVFADWVTRWFILEPKRGWGNIPLKIEKGLVQVDEHPCIIVDYSWSLGREYERAVRYFKNENYKMSFELFQAINMVMPNFFKVDDVVYYETLALRWLGAEQQSEDMLDTLIEKYPRSPVIPSAAFLKAILEIKSDKELSTLREIPVEKFLTEELFVQKILLHISGFNGEVFDSLVAPDSTLKKRSNEEVEQLIDKLTSQEMVKPYLHIVFGTVKGNQYVEELLVESDFTLEKMLLLLYAKGILASLDPVDPYATGNKYFEYFEHFTPWIYSVEMANPEITKPFIDTHVYEHNCVGDEKRKEFYLQEPRPILLEDKDFQNVLTEYLGVWKKR